MKFRRPPRALSTLTVCMVLLVIVAIGAQRASAPRADDQATARLVAGMIERLHISKHPIDDAISSKLLDRYIKSLDSQKLYFSKSQIESFEGYRDQLDDMVKVGNVGFAYQVFDEYLAQLNKRMEMAHQLIDVPHDFTVKEDMYIDADDVDWAATEEELQDRWRKRVKFEMLSLKLDDVEEKEIRERLHKRYRNIERQLSQTSNTEKLEIFLSALAHCFDPHSSYLSPDTLDDFEIQMRLSLEGIGAELRSEDGYTIVNRVVDDGPAAKDGRLKKGDKIIAVDPGDGNFVDIVEMKLTKVVRYIRGAKGTQVRLKVKTEVPVEGDLAKAEEKKTKSEIRVYDMIRERVALKSQEVQGKIINAKDRFGERDARIGVIDIPAFYRDFNGARNEVENFKSTSRDVKRVLKSFRDQGGVDGIVIDLRDNGGGALSEAIEVSGLFFQQGPVVSVKDQNGDLKTHSDDDERVFYTGPLMVVCNRLSASASEIFAGAMKDYGRGLIVGDETTHGKGSVQNVMNVSRPLLNFFRSPVKRGALKLTISQFYRVNGASTQNDGVQSDIVLPSLYDHMELGESFLDNALKSSTETPVAHKSFNYVPQKVVSQLRQSSKTRVMSDKEFQNLIHDINTYEAKKNRKTVSLNEDVRRKELEDEKVKEELAEKVKEADEEEKEELFPKSFYNDELLRIATDYVEALKGVSTASVN